jgi:hypothetical protein
MTLTPADIRVWWPRIKPALEAAGEEGMTSPEELYHGCRSGSDRLYICGEADGFVILNSYTNDQTGEPEAFIVMGCWFGGPCAVGSLLEIYMPEIEKLARAAGAKTLAFRTLRKGFEKALDQTIWRVRAIEYVRTL